MLFGVLLSKVAFAVNRIALYNSCWGNSNSDFIVGFNIEIAVIAHELPGYADIYTAHAP